LKERSGFGGKGGKKKEKTTTSLSSSAGEKKKKRVKEKKNLLDLSSVARGEKGKEKLGLLFSR